MGKFKLVEIYILQGFSLSGLAAVIDIFREAQQTKHASRYILRIVSHESQVNSDAGISFTAEALEAATPPADLFILIGGDLVFETRYNDPMFSLVLTRASTARRLAAVSSGVHLLLKFGLVTNQEVAMHWQHADSAEKLHKQTTINFTCIFVQDGRLWTAASTSACIDMLLAMVSSDYGAAVARQIALNLTLGQIRNTTSRQGDPMVHLFTGFGPFDKLHLYVRENIRQQFTLEGMADFCGMSSRSFLRKYREKVGTTPAKSIDKIRVELAVDLVAFGNLSTKRIVQLCGYGSEETMRRSFLRTFGLTPKQYHDQHRSPLENGLKSS